MTKVIKNYEHVQGTEEGNISSSHLQNSNLMVYYCQPLLAELSYTPVTIQCTPYITISISVISPCDE